MKNYLNANDVMKDFFPNYKQNENQKIINLEFHQEETKILKKFDIEISKILNDNAHQNCT